MIRFTLGTGLCTSPPARPGLSGAAPLTATPRCFLVLGSGPLNLHHWALPLLATRAGPVPCSSWTPCTPDWLPLQPGNREGRSWKGEHSLNR